MTIIGHPQPKPLHFSSHHLTLITLKSTPPYPYKTSKIVNIYMNTKKWVWEKLSANKKARLFQEMRAIEERGEFVELE